MLNNKLIVCAMPRLSDARKSDRRNCSLSLGFSSFERCAKNYEEHLINLILHFLAGIGTPWNFNNPLSIKIFSCSLKYFVACFLSLLELSFNFPSNNAFARELVGQSTNRFSSLPFLSLRSCLKLHNLIEILVKYLSLRVNTSTPRAAPYRLKMK